MYQQGVSTDFFQWHQGAEGKGAQISILHFMLSYFTLMEISLLPWDDLSSILKGEVTCRANGYTNCITASLHCIGATIYVPT